MLQISSMRIGSGLFVDGIDELLEGAEPGTVLNFEAPLPVGFGDRAGEQVDFEVIVNEVKERILPELDDAWIDENTEFETVEELKAELGEHLAEAKLQSVSRQYAERALSTLVDQVEIQLPEGLVRSEMDDHLHRFVHRLEDSELTLDDYFQASGIDQDQFLDDLRQQAEISIRNQLVLEAVAKDAGIDVTPEDVSAVIQTAAARSGDPVAYLQAFRQSGRELAVAGDILRNRALDAILSAANPVDEDGNPIDLKMNVTEVEAEIVEAEIVEAEPVGDIPMGEVPIGEVVATAAEEEDERPVPELCDPHSLRTDESGRALLRHLQPAPQGPDHLPWYADRRHHRQPDHGPAPSPRVRGPGQGHLPLHQLAGWFDHFLVRDLRHDAVHQAGGEHGVHGHGRLGGCGHPRWWGGGQALRPTPRPGHASPAARWRPGPGLGHRNPGPAHSADARVAEPRSLPSTPANRWKRSRRTQSVTTGVAAEAKDYGVIDGILTRRELAAVAST